VASLLTLNLTDTVFLLCLLAGGGLMLVSLVIGEVSDLIGGLGIDLEVAGVGIVSPLLGFVALFGAGGLFATQALKLSDSNASFVGLGAGVAGFLGVFGMLRFFRRSEGGPEFQVGSLVGSSGRLTVGVKPGSAGEVELRAMGAKRRFIATCEAEIPVGSLVTVTGVSGDTLIVKAAG
jgi:hypothetical protein